MQTLRPAIAFLEIQPRKQTGVTEVQEDALNCRLELPSPRASSVALSKHLAALQNAQPTERCNSTRIQDVDSYLCPTKTFFPPFI